MSDDSTIAFVSALFALVIAFAGLIYPSATTTLSYDNITDIPAIDLEHGLCLWLPFDGVVLDKSGYRNDASSAGVVAYNDLVYDKGAYSNISGTFTVAHSDVVDNPEVSVSFWFNFSSYNRNYNWVCNKYNATVGYRSGWLTYVYNVSNVYHFGFRVANGDVFGSNVYGTADISLDTVYFVCCYCNLDGAGFYMYDADGVLIEHKTTVGSVVGSNSLALYVLSSYGGAFVNATVDDFRLYNRVLSQYEISQLYTLGV